MRRREFDLGAVRPEERARRLADARRDALGIAGRQIEHVDLIEGIAGLALALEHQPLAVRRPVAFAGALAFDGQPPDAAQEIAFLRWRLGLTGHRHDSGNETRPPPPTGFDTRIHPKPRPSRRETSILIRMTRLLALVLAAAFFAAPRARRPDGRGHRRRREVLAPLARSVRPGPRARRSIYRQVVANRERVEGDACPAAATRRRSSGAIVFS